LRKRTSEPLPRGVDALSSRAEDGVGIHEDRALCQSRYAVAETFDPPVQCLGDRTALAADYRCEILD
jgi:hypothetical protein